VVSLAYSTGRQHSLQHYPLRHHPLQQPPNSTDVPHLPALLLDTNQPALMRERDCVVQFTVTLAHPPSSVSINKRWWMMSHIHRLFFPLLLLLLTSSVRGEYAEWCSLLPSAVAPSHLASERRADRVDLLPFCSPVLCKRQGQSSVFLSLLPLLPRQLVW